MESKTIQNIAINKFLNSILEYNSVNLLNKSEFEIILEGLEVYKKVPGCTSASLFYLDKHSLEFFFKTSTALDEEEEIKDIFDKMVEDGCVAKTLSDLDVVEFIPEEPKLGFGTILLSALVTSYGVIAISFLTFKNFPDEVSIYFEMIRHHSDNFAHRLQNIELQSEIEQTKLEFENRIALNAKDIANSTRELKLILDSVQIGIIIVDKYNDVIIDANTKAAEIIGTTKELLIGTRKSDHFFLIDKIRFKEELRIDEEGLIKRSNGSLVPIIKTTDTLRIDGHDSHIISFMDITQRKRGEEELHKAHFELERRVEERTLELLKANDSLRKEIHDREKAEEDVLKLYWAVHQNPSSIMITNTNGVIEYVNPQFSEMTGYKYEEMVGRNPRILKSGEVSSKEYAILWNKVSAGDEWHGKFRNKKKNGELFWVSASISAIRNNLGEITHYLCIEEDITEAKNAYKELLEAKERAEKSDKLKSQILANMNHEFRTPLISILGFSQVLISDELSEEQMEMVNSIYFSGKRLLNTSDGILTLSQLESQQYSLEQRAINIVELVQKPVEEYRTLANEKGLELKLNIDCENASVMGDVQLLCDSIGYLLDNAVKYTNKGEINIKVGKTQNETAYIKIEDTGIGIELSKHKIIFEAFRQVSEGYSRSYEGCGIGLTIAQKYIQLLNGEITLESELSVGSTFTIRLPLINHRQAE